MYESMNVILYATYLIDLAKEHGFCEKHYNYLKIAQLHAQQNKLIPWLQALSAELTKRGILHLLAAPVA